MLLYLKQISTIYRVRFTAFAQLRQLRNKEILRTESWFLTLLKTKNDLILIVTNVYVYMETSTLLVSYAPA